MAIASMTGFAREAGTTGPAHWAWELKSVNGRGLEVRVRVPAGLDAVGEEARAVVQKRFSRGTCHLTLTLSRAEAAPRVRINEALLASLAEAVTRVPMPLGITLPSVDGLLHVRGVVEVEEEASDDEALRRDLAAAALRLVEALAEGRRAEGRALSDIVGGQLAVMADLVEAAEACPARKPEAVKARLAAQVAALMEAGGLDPARLHQEAVLLAARADVREEIDRLRAHLTAARDLLSAGGAVGRRLDFLAQELGREANTLCAKANDVALSRIGLDLKAVVEQFREQVQNVE
ncbi:YicC/YloC family endoribonuclease [Methylobacterium nonmethylotrophicum]|uniref:YicC family protein n=1 Tax=Methylobacterium nonmethylotrophicum TaxID=1141884 RepID=A0A4Z0NEA5_9HYPH|nr:YicC/YloC family endoribonuclease [Methylobacterium nonmethylotrophicum]TGD92880.1 YicC family protein [Methylobacterium nonmethylotrophicum]